MTCAPSLIRAFAVHMKKAWVLSYPMSAQRRLWSNWVDAQADVSLRWAHMPFCWFCHEAAQLINFWTLITICEKTCSNFQHSAKVRIWARPWENASYAICKQQRRRSACAFAQSDQCLCCSLPRQNDTSSLHIRIFKSLAGLCSCADQFVSFLVGDSRRHILSWRGSYALIRSKETIAPMAKMTVKIRKNNLTRPSILLSGG